jgi:hypothetical protein
VWVDPRSRQVVGNRVDDGGESMGEGWMMMPMGMKQP